MDELSIKVTIGNREYPLKINRIDEERVQQAVQMIQSRIHEFELQYPASDKYDHLAMSTMRIAGELVEQTAKEQCRDQELDNRIAELDLSIARHLANINVH